MKLLLVILSGIFVSTTTVFAQDNYNRVKGLTSEELFLKSKPHVFTKSGEKYLILDATSGLAGFRRFRYFPGDNIHYRLKSEPGKFHETIAEVSDSTFSIIVENEVLRRMEHVAIKFSDVKSVRTSRRIPFITEAGFYLPLAGLLYVGADFFNKGVDNKRFTTDASSLIVGGALVGGGIICYKLSFSKIKIGKSNRLRVVETY